MDINWNYLKVKLNAYSETVKVDKFSGAVTTTMPRTFLLGNGDISVISAGGGNTKEYLIAKGDFWSAGNLVTNEPMKLDAKRLTNIAFGGVSFIGFTGGQFTESLDIACGRLRTTKGGITIDAICDQNHNAIIYKLTTIKDVELKVKLWAKSDIAEYPTSVIEHNGQIYLSRKTANFATEDTRSWTSVVSSSLTSNGELKYLGYGEGYAEYSLKLYCDRDTYVIVGVGGGGKTFDNKGMPLTKSPESEIESIFDGLKNQNELVARLFDIELWWQEYWRRSYVHLSDELVEKYYYGSMYLLACFARAGKLPTGLYGNFVTTDKPKWQNDFHLNYNYIAPFYGAYASNRCDFAQDIVEPLIDFIPEGKKRAMEDLAKVSKGYVHGGKAGKYRFRGRKELRNGIANSVLFPVGIAPYGICSWNLNGGYLTQMYDAAFTATCITAYYSFTLDGEYLKKAEELLRLIVNFFIAWREKEVTEKGYRYNIWNGAHEDTFEMNTPGALGAIKSILQCLLKGVDRGDISSTESDIIRWKDFLEHLSPYPIRQYVAKKRFKKIFDKPIVLMGEKGLEISVGQTISLEFIHPAYDMDFFTDKKLVVASRNVIELYKLLDTKVYEQINAFPKNFTHAIMCGVPAEEIVAEFKKVLGEQFCYNYSVDDGDVHGVEKCGATEFVHAMLLMSDGEIVKVFPNAERGKKLEFKNLRARGAYLVSSARNESGKVEFVEIMSEKQSNINLINPFVSPIVTNADGESIPFEIKEIKGIKVISFIAKQQYFYTIKETLSV